MREREGEGGRETVRKREKERIGEKVSNCRYNVM